MQDVVIILLFSNKSSKFFVNIITFLEINKCVIYMIYIYIFNVFWFLHILKQALLLNANTQNPENIIYLLTKQAACLCVPVLLYIIR